MPNSFIETEYRLAISKSSFLALIKIVDLFNLQYLATLNKMSDVFVSLYILTYKYSLANLGREENYFASPRSASNIK